MKQIKVSADKDNKSISQNKSDLPAIPTSLETMKKELLNVGTPYKAEAVVRNAYKEYVKSGIKKAERPESNIFREMTLREFDVGILMTIALPETLRTFALDMSKKLQEEFDCKTVSEKSLAEMAALNYCRVLYIQRRMEMYLERDQITDIGVGFLKYTSQELDRAERHYLTSLQTLKSRREPPMQVNFRANTAVIGQNQVVQVKENEINKAK